MNNVGISVGTMIKRLNGLTGTDELSPKDERFVESIVQDTKNGTYTSAVSEAQLKWIINLFNYHFAG